MAENSKIEWTHHTANLWHGCTKVHAGCDHCYAETLSHRWGRDIWGNDKPRMVIKSVWNDLEKYQAKAAAVGEMHRVFVGSMMDIFEKPMPLVDSKGRPVLRDGQQMTTDHARQHFFFHVIPDCPNLLFLLLTKRPGNTNKYIPESWKQNPPANVMFGTSPCDQKTADTLIPQLLEVKGKHFLSIEPLLGPVDLRLTEPMPGQTEQYYHTRSEGIDWVICGGESGHGARPMHPDWVRSLRDQCNEAAVPFFFKQWGEYRLHSQTNMYELHEVDGKSPHKHSYYDSALNKTTVFGGDWIRCGKKSAGRKLDGVLHDEFPKPQNFIPQKQ